MAAEVESITDEIVEIQKDSEKTFGGSGQALDRHARNPALSELH